MRDIAHGGVAEATTAASSFEAGALLKSEHSVVARQIRLGRAVRVRVASVVVLHDMEAADIDIEVDVALLEIGRVGRPDFRVRVMRLDGVQALRPIPRPNSPTFA